MRLERGSIWQIARKEAALGLRSRAVWGVLVLVFFGTVALIAFVAEKLESEPINSPESLILILGAFLTVAMSMGIMMNSTLVGSSMAEEKDKKVVEILLSLVRAEELYIGKLLGHCLIGFAQLIFLWGTVIVSALAFGVTSLGNLPIGFCVVMAVLMLQSYLLYTALYALAGALVTSVEDYTVAQIPILFLFMSAMLLPFAPMVGWGSFAEGWLPIAAWVPPLAMAAAPILDALADGAWYRTAVAIVIFFVEIGVLNWFGMQIFRKRILQ